MGLNVGDRGADGEVRIDNAKSHDDGGRIMKANWMRMDMGMGMGHGPWAIGMGMGMGMGTGMGTGIDHGHGAFKEKLEHGAGSMGA